MEVGRLVVVWHIRPGNGPRTEPTDAVEHLGVGGLHCSYIHLWNPTKLVTKFSLHGTMGSQMSEGCTVPIYICETNKVGDQVFFGWARGQRKLLKREPCRIGKQAIGTTLVGLALEAPCPTVVDIDT